MNGINGTHYHSLRHVGRETIARRTGQGEVVMEVDITFGRAFVRSEIVRYCRNEWAASAVRMAWTPAAYGEAPPRYVDVTVRFFTPNHR